METTGQPAPNPERPPPRLLDRVRDEMRRLGYSSRTERTYLAWIRQYILYHGKRHPDTMGEVEITGFLTHLATRRNVAASTQNQALSAILFLYRRILERGIGWLGDVERPQRPERLPVVLTPAEVRALFSKMRGVTWLMAALLYGSGLRRLECCRLRVKDIDFERREIVIRNAKGQKDRGTVLPARLFKPLMQHLEDVRVMNAETTAESKSGKRRPRAGANLLLLRLAIPVSYRDNTTTPNRNVLQRFRAPPSLREFSSKHSPVCWRSVDLQSKIVRRVKPSMHFSTLPLLLLLGSELATAASTPHRTEDRRKLRCSEESRKRFKVEAVMYEKDIPPKKVVKPPKKTVNAQPEFPELPPSTTVSGIWIGEVLIAADGSVADTWALYEPRLTPPFPEFNEAILKAIKKWEYEPVIVEGERMPFCMVVTVNIDFK